MSRISPGEAQGGDLGPRHNPPAASQHEKQDPTRPVWSAGDQDGVQSLSARPPAAYRVPCPQRLSATLSVPLKTPAQQRCPERLPAVPHPHSRCSSPRRSTWPHLDISNPMNTLSQGTEFHPNLSFLRSLTALGHRADPLSLLR